MKRFRKSDLMAGGMALLCRKGLVGLGYRRVDQSELSWVADGAGIDVVRSVEDWSPQGLDKRRGWSFWDKGSHGLYLAEGPGGGRFLVKVYHRGHASEGSHDRRENKAKREFYNTLYAYKKGFQTVLPCALGERTRGERCGVIIYPFLEDVVPLDRAYEEARLPVGERQSLERSVGRILRRCMEVGFWSANMCPGHFLAKRGQDGRLVVYWVDFEKVKFRFLSKKKYAVENLAKLLARLEWFRISGGRVNRASMMRIGHGCFDGGESGKLDKKLCRAVIKATSEYWQHRRMHTRGLYSSTSIDAMKPSAP